MSHVFWDLTSCFYWFKIDGDLLLLREEDVYVYICKKVREDMLVAALLQTTVTMSSSSSEGINLKNVWGRNSTTHSSIIIRMKVVNWLCFARMVYLLWGVKLGLGKEAMRPGIDPPLSDHPLLLCEIEEEERGQRSYVGLVKNWEWVEWWFYKPSSLVLPLCC